MPEGAEVVVSSAIPPENPERAVARERGQRELHRAELLGELTRLKPTIAISGTHGKTTTSSMVVHALRGCGLDPSYLVGGEVRSTGANAGWGAGEWLVVEADESDRSLLKLSPRIAVLTNAELDHHTTYSSRRDVDDTFRAFLGLAEQAVVWDRPELLALAGDTPVTPFDVVAPELGESGSRFAVDGVEVSLPRPGRPQRPQRRRGADRGPARGRRPRAGRRRPRGLRRRRPPLRAPRHDRRRSARGRRLRAPPDRGARHDRGRPDAGREPHRRRLPAAPVLAHAPHRRASSAPRSRWPTSSSCSASTRRASAQEDFPGVTGRLVAAAAADAAGGRPVAWLPGFDEAEAYLRATLREGDILLTLGAGDVDALGRRLLALRPGQSVRTCRPNRRAWGLTRRGQESGAAGRRSRRWLSNPQ